MKPLAPSFRLCKNICLMSSSEADSSDDLDSVDASVTTSKNGPKQGPRRSQYDCQKLFLCRVLSAFKAFQERMKKINAAAPSGCYVSGLAFGAVDYIAKVRGHQVAKLNKPV